MERELRLGDKVVVLDDRTGALERSIDVRTGRPLPDTSQDRTIEVTRLPPEGLPNTCDPLGTAHAEGQLYGAVYDGRIAPAAFAVGWMFITLSVFMFSLALLWGDWTSPGAYAVVGLIVVAWAWLFQRARRRMRERKQRLDASIPSR
ncbi:hypothetical protein C8J98_10740 [Luteibacter sp. OK325]|uniref:hypothetical protein n=1 Tax=Luteibacter sp. OK325 TaxID=2135670 RepID=UPI000D385E52|nr:hypothetical protein [Luteibacter sp. OK325]PTR29909.1 hypothetical protein C8J98_10740 [Luteibacter sp. OK325]